MEGKRTDAVVYVFEREGDVVIPGYTMYWFNLESEELEAVQIPARTITVLLNPAMSGTGVVADSKAVRGLSAMGRRLLILFPLALIGLAFVGYAGKRMWDYYRRSVKVLPPLNPTLRSVD